MLWGHQREARGGELSGSGDVLFEISTTGKGARKEGGRRERSRKAGRVSLGVAKESTHRRRSVNLDGKERRGSAGTNGRRGKDDGEKTWEEAGEKTTERRCEPGRKGTQEEGAGYEACRGFTVMACSGGRGVNRGLTRYGEKKHLDLSEFPNAFEALEPPHSAVPAPTMRNLRAIVDGLVRRAEDEKKKKAKDESVCKAQPGKEETGRRDGRGQLIVGEVERFEEWEEGFACTA